MLSALYSDKLYINGVEKKTRELKSSEEEESIKNETDLVSCWFFSNLHSLIISILRNTRSSKIKCFSKI